jgi:hypothetical protein
MMSDDPRQELIARFSEATCEVVATDAIVIEACMNVLANVLDCQNSDEGRRRVSEDIRQHLERIIEARSPRPKPTVTATGPLRRA